jgi:hypothetical protein
LGPAAARHPPATSEIVTVSLPPTPSTYASWLDFLDRFQAGDDLVLPVLEGGTIAWSAGVAQRWTQRVSETLDVRLRALEKQLQRSLDRAAGDLHAVARALGEARRGLAPLARFCALAAMPAEVQAHLRRELERWMEQTQKSLEGQAARHRGDQGLLLATLRACRLDQAAAAADAPTRQTTGPRGLAEKPPAVGSRPRRILLE